MAEFKRKPKGRKPGRFGRRDSDRPERRDGGRSDRRRPRFSSRDRPEKTTVTCDSCKRKCEVPFKPTANKPVYCDDCFKKNDRKKDSKSPDYSKELTEINRKLDRILRLIESA